MPPTSRGPSPTEAGQFTFDLSPVAPDTTPIEPFIPFPTPLRSASTAPRDLDHRSESYVFADTGHVGGTRKEAAAAAIRSAARTGARLRFSEIDWSGLEENPREAVLLITKSHLFGAVDWEALRAAGMSPAAGFLVDRVYASVAPGAPDGAEGRQDYARGLESLRDRLEACMTPTDVTAALEGIRDEIDGMTFSPEEAAAIAAARAAAREVADRFNALREEERILEGKLREVEVALALRKRDQERRADRKWKPDPSLDEAVVALAGDVADARARLDAYRAAHPEIVTSARRTGPTALTITNDLRAQVVELRRVESALTTAAQNRILAENTTTRGWRALGDRFRSVVFFPSKRYGSDAFAKHVTAAKSGRVEDWSWAERERASVAAPPKREVLFQMRVAETFDRAGGRPVVTDSTAALKNRYGLKEVLSGKWVLTDLTAASFHVGHCGTALADLADLLGVSDENLGLGGRLAVAFGAYGKGAAGSRTGTAPVAQYIPTHQVLNITKRGGGGSLAHEWFHAWDDLIAEAAGIPRRSGASPFVSDDPKVLPSDHPLRAPYEALVSALTTGSKRFTETVVYSPEDVRLASPNVRNGYTTVGKLIARAPDAAEAVRSVDRYYEKEFGVLSDMKRKQTNQWKAWRRLAAAHHHADPTGGEVQIETGAGVSDFLFHAVEMDEGERARYWSSRAELAARAFQCWCEDRLAEAGRRSDYLSWGANNRGYEPFKPFPEGDERRHINLAFDALFAAARQCSAVFRPESRMRIAA